MNSLSTQLRTENSSDSRSLFIAICAELTTPDSKTKILRPARLLAAPPKPGFAVSCRTWQRRFDPYWNHLEATAAGGLRRKGGDIHPGPSPPVAFEGDLSGRVGQRGCKKCYSLVRFQHHPFTCDPETSLLEGICCTKRRIPRNWTPVKSRCGADVGSRGFDSHQDHLRGVRSSRRQANVYVAGATPALPAKSVPREGGILLSQQHALSGTRTAETEVTPT